MTRTQTSILVFSAAVMALVATAVGASYLTRSAMTEEAAAPKTEQARTVKHRPQQRVAAAQPQQAPCDDGNVVGTAAGAVAGGLVGNQFGKGTGKTVTTVGGVVAGGALGNHYIPTRGTLCK